MPLKLLERARNLCCIYPTVCAADDPRTQRLYPSIVIIMEQSLAHDIMLELDLRFYGQYMSEVRNKTQQRQHLCNSNNTVLLKDERPSVSYSVGSYENKAKHKASKSRKKRDEDVSYKSLGP